MSHTRQNRNSAFSKQISSFKRRRERREASRRAIERTRRGRSRSTPSRAQLGASIGSRAFRKKLSESIEEAPEAFNKTPGTPLPLVRKSFRRTRNKELAPRSTTRNLIPTVPKGTPRVSIGKSPFIGFKETSASPGFALLAARRGKEASEKARTERLGRATIGSELPLFASRGSQLAAAAVFRERNPPKTFSGRVARAPGLSRLPPTAKAFIAGATAPVTTIKDFRSGRLTKSERFAGTAGIASIFIGGRGLGFISKIGVQKLALRRGAAAGINALRAVQGAGGLLTIAAGVEVVRQPTTIKKLDIISSAGIGGAGFAKGFSPAARGVRVLRQTGASSSKGGSFGALSTKPATSLTIFSKGTTPVEVDFFGKLLPGEVKSSASFRGRAAGRKLSGVVGDEVPFIDLDKQLFSGRRTILSELIVRGKKVGSGVEVSKGFVSSRSGQFAFSNEEGALDVGFIFGQKEFVSTPSRRINIVGTRSFRFEKGGRTTENIFSSLVDIPIGSTKSLSRRSVPSRSVRSSFLNEGKSFKTKKGFISVESIVPKSFSPFASEGRAGSISSRQAVNILKDAGVLVSERSGGLQEGLPLGRRGLARRRTPIKLFPGRKGSARLIKGEKDNLLEGLIVSRRSAGFSGSKQKLRFVTRSRQPTSISPEINTFSLETISNKRMLLSLFPLRTGTRSKDRGLKTTPPTSINNLFISPARMKGFLSPSSRQKQPSTFISGSPPITTPGQRLGLLTTSASRAALKSRSAPPPSFNTLNLFGGAASIPGFIIPPAGFPIGAGVEGGRRGPAVETRKMRGFEKSLISTVFTIRPGAGRSVAVTGLEIRIKKRKKKNKGRRRNTPGIPFVGKKRIIKKKKINKKLKRRKK